jgi:N-acetylmuramoyl-L-alanine amidase
VQGAVVAGLGAFDRGVKQADYAVVRQTRCAAVLVEGGFINNPSAARAIATPEYRDRLAIAIADGVSTYHRRRLLDARQGSLAKGR